MNVKLKIEIKEFPNADLMTADELCRELELGLESARLGRVKNASEAFDEFINSYSKAELQYNLGKMSPASLGGGSHLRSVGDTIPY